jgi:hypothetical protein
MAEQIRRIRADDVDRIRTARLAALADAPDAFGSTLRRDWRCPTRSGGTVPPSSGISRTASSTPAGGELAIAVDSNGG